ALGHRRLSVLDLSEAGAQPMRSQCGRYVISFNGEIYNHPTLREALASDVAVTWRGDSDTETLLECISRWGIEEALAATVGMFAIAVWDERNKSLSLARDRFGEKPLYYGCVGGTLVFASDLRAIGMHPKFNAE